MQRKKQAGKFGERGIQGEGNGGREGTKIKCGTVRLT